MVLRLPKTIISLNAFLLLFDNHSEQWPTGHDANSLPHNPLVMKYLRHPMTLCSLAAGKNLSYDLQGCVNVCFWCITRRGGFSRNRRSPWRRKPMFVGWWKPHRSPILWRELLDGNEVTASLRDAHSSVNGVSWKHLQALSQISEWCCLLQITNLFPAALVTRPVKFQKLWAENG